MLDSVLFLLEAAASKTKRVFFSLSAVGRAERHKIETAILTYWYGTRRITESTVTNIFMNVGRFTLAVDI